MKSILSTKKLSISQKKLLLNASLSLIEYNAITTETIDFGLPKRKIKNVIFTSKNAVNALLGKIEAENCFCVGEKTAALLTENGFKVKEIADYGAELAPILIEKYSEEKFTFFCGNKRKDDIPNGLAANGIPLEEIQVYKTSLNPVKLNQNFDAILFFSPSGVQSYVSRNELKDTTAFCIGTTTAAEAKKHTDDIVIANRPSIENVIVQAVKYFKKDE